MAFTSTKNYSQWQFCVTLVSMSKQNYIQCNIYQLRVIGNDKAHKFIRTWILQQQLAEKLGQMDSTMKHWGQCTNSKFWCPKSIGDIEQLNTYLFWSNRVKTIPQKLSFSHSPSKSRFQYTSDHLRTQYNGTTTGNSSQFDKQNQ